MAENENIKNTQRKKKRLLKKKMALNGLNINSHNIVSLIDGDDSASSKSSDMSSASDESA